MSQIIIGISGKKRHGKDHACAVLKTKGWEDSVDVRRLAFADALKQELASACGVSVEFIELNKPSFRLGLQWWGTEFRRGHCGDDYWLRRMDEALLTTTSAVVVVPDVRFVNEADWVKSRGGVVVRINRTADVPGTKDAHLSETALDDYEFDYVLENNMTETFNEEVSSLWATVIRPRLHELPATVV